MDHLRGRSGSFLGTNRYIALAALVVTLPLAAGARPDGDYTPVLAQPGDQSDPSISGNWIVFASSTAGDWDVLRLAIGTDVVEPVAQGPGDQDQPDVAGAIVGYRGANGVYVRDSAGLIRVPGQQGAACGQLALESQPTVGAQVAAWECATETARSIAVFTQGGVPEYRLPGDDLYAPAAFGSLVAFIDGADGGSVWLHDSGTGTTDPVCPGMATGVAVGNIGESAILAATRRTEANPGDPADVEVWRPARFEAALRIRDEQRNPHISGDWVAFEDVSTDGSKVVLWQWTTGLVFLPNPWGTNDQTLNDLATITGSEVRVVFAEAPPGGETDRDIALYRLVLNPDGSIPENEDPNTLPWDPVEPPAAVSCDDDVVPLATFTLERGRGTPRAAWADFEARGPGDDTPMPVLVCVEGTQVTSGWVTLDHEAIAWPGDFEADQARIEIPAVASGLSRVAAVIAGKPGSKLTVRVLADPDRPPPGCGEAAGGGGSGVGEGGARLQSKPEGDQGLGNAGWQRVPDGRFDRRICVTRIPQPEGGAAAHGCSTGGAGGFLALLALAVAAHLKRRR